MTAPHVETPGEVGTGRALREHQTADASVVSDSHDEGKQYATLRALLAFKGISLHELSDGGYLIASAFNTLHCPSLHEVKAFCQRAGVRA